MLFSHPPNDIEQANDIMDTCFATVAYASKVPIPCPLNMSPGAKVFHQVFDLKIYPLLQIYINYMNGNTL